MFHTDESQRHDVMPFVLCRANGGPYDDEAFLSGWRLGDIDATLAGPGIRALASSIHPRELDQADLIAMARGYRMLAERTSEPEWISVTFTRITQDDL